MNPVWSTEIRDGRASSRHEATNLDRILKSTLYKLIGQYEGQSRGSLPLFKQREIEA